MPYINIFIRRLVGNLWKFQKQLNAYLMIFPSFPFCLFYRRLKVTIFLCSGWIIILLTIFPIYLMLMISDDRHVMAVCWFRRIDMRVERNFDKDYYWFEVQILLTTLLTIFLPISLIVACNIRVLTIGKPIDFAGIEVFASKRLIYRARTIDIETKLIFCE